MLRSIGDRAGRKAWQDVRFFTFSIVTCRPVVQPSVGCWYPWALSRRHDRTGDGTCRIGLSGHRPGRRALSATPYDFPATLRRRGPASRGDRGRGHPAPRPRCRPPNNSWPKCPPTRPCAILDQRAAPADPGRDRTRPHRARHRDLCRPHERGGRRLGIGRSTLYRKVREQGLEDAVKGAFGRRRRGRYGGGLEPPYSAPPLAGERLGEEGDNLSTVMSSGG